MPETSFLFRDVCSIAYSLIVAQAGILIFFGGGGVPLTATVTSFRRTSGSTRLRNQTSGGSWSRRRRTPSRSPKASSRRARSCGASRGNPCGALSSARGQRVHSRKDTSACISSRRCRSSAHSPSPPPPRPAAQAPLCAGHRERAQDRARSPARTAFRWRRRRP